MRVSRGMFRVMQAVQVALSLTTAETGRRRTWRWVGAGGVIALGCLCRPTLQALLPFVALWAGWVVWRTEGRRPAMARTAILTVVVSTLLVPFQYRNWRRHGESNLSPVHATDLTCMADTEEYYRTLTAGSQ